MWCACESHRLERLLRATPASVVTVGGWFISTDWVISTERKNLVLGDLRSLPALEMTNHCSCQVSIALS